MMRMSAYPLEWAGTALPTFKSVNIYIILRWLTLNGTIKQTYSRPVMSNINSQIMQCVYEAALNAHQMVNGQPL